LAELKFLGYLTKIAGARVKQVSLKKPVPLRRIVPPAFPEKDIIILIDEKVGNLDSLIENDSSVVIMPIISGG
jgi:hypothetical protein